MSTSTPPRIWTSTLTPKKGEMVRVRAQSQPPHGDRPRLDEHGQIKPRDIVTRFEAHLGEGLLYAWEPGPATARNPYIEFTFLARESGELRLSWKGDGDFTLEATRTITVQ